MTNALIDNLFYSYFNQGYEDQDEAGDGESDDEDEDDGNDEEHSETELTKHIHRKSLSEESVVRSAEGERVADIGGAIRDEYIRARDASTSTGTTYAPYQKDFKKYCNDMGWSSAVTDMKLLHYLKHKKEKKTPKKKGQSMKGGSHVIEAGGEKVEYALKTMKGTVCAIVDLWCQQEGQSIEFNGELFSRGPNHPRSASVKAFLKSHRVTIILLLLSLFHC